jgi:hypothetical protein
MKDGYPYIKLKDIVDLKSTIMSQTSVCFSNQRILIFGGIMNKTKTNQLFELSDKQLLKIVPEGDVPPERSSHSAIIRKVTTDKETKETMVCKI